MYEVKLTLDTGKEIQNKFETFEQMISFVVEHEECTATMEILANGEKCE
jgi:hypothetical protein